MIIKIQILLLSQALPNNITAITICWQTEIFIPGPVLTQFFYILLCILVIILSFNSCISSYYRKKKEQKKEFTFYCLHCCDVFCSWSFVGFYFALSFVELFKRKPMIKKEGNFIIQILIGALFLFSTRFCLSKMLFASKKRDDVSDELFTLQWRDWIKLSSSCGILKNCLSFKLKARSNTSRKQRETDKKFPEKKHK